MGRKAASYECPAPVELAPLLTHAITSVASAIFITDTAGRIVWVNDAFTRLSGYAAREAIGRTPNFLKSGRQTPSFYRELWQTIGAGDVWRGEVIERHKDGTFYSVDEIITPLRNGEGPIAYFVAVQNDITQRKQEGERDHFLAYHDALTGLPNRALLLNSLAEAILRARRSRRKLAVYFVDLDNFKPINDSFGHTVGDRLLVAVGERLSAAVRKSDVVARLGGDEFAIVQAGIPSSEIADVARKLLEAIAQPFVLEGSHISTTASIGIALYPGDGDKPETLLDKADQAMYRAKQLGRNRYQYISADAGDRRILRRG